MSYTILPYTAPYTREALDALNMQSAFLAQTNNFSVPQHFAGIINSGSGAMVSLAVSGNASIVGSLNAGACTVASLVISDALSVSQNGASITGDIYNAGNLSTVALTVRENGASITGDIVNSGDLTTNKLTVLQNGASITGDIYNAGNLSTVALTVRENGASITGDIYNAGSLSTVALTVRENGANIIGGVDITGSLHATADVVFDGALSASGEASFKSLKTLPSVVPLVSSNNVIVDLIDINATIYTLTLSDNLQFFTFNNVLSHLCFSMCVRVSGSPIINKVQSYGGVTVYNNLNGNVQCIDGSIFRVNCNCISANEVECNWTNFN